MKYIYMSIYIYIYLEFNDYLYDVCVYIGGSVLSNLLQALEDYLRVLLGLLKEGELNFFFFF